jgi:regulator of cell morphogenesis and NO signaling
MEITTTTHVADIAAASPRAAAWFHAHGIDFCCGGKRPLSDVCAEAGLDAETVRAELAALPASSDEVDWTTQPLSDLASHIVGFYHARLREDLPRIAGLLERVVSRHGERRPELGQLGTTFRDLAAELLSHMEKEEQVLFPHIRALEAAAEGRGGRGFLPLGLAAGATGVMEREHETAALALQAIRRLTSGFTPPEDACASYRALFAGLEAFDAELRRHIHLENNILFPRAVHLELEQRSGAPAKF